MNRKWGWTWALLLALGACGPSPEQQQADARAAMRESVTAFEAGAYETAQESYARVLAVAPGDSAYDGFIVTNLATLKYKSVIEAYNRWEEAQYGDQTGGAAPTLLGADTAAATTDGLLGAVGSFDTYSTDEPNPVSPLKFQLLAAQRAADPAGYARLKTAVRQALGIDN